MQKFLQFLKNNLAVVYLSIIFFIFSWPIFLQGYIIGPFDYLMQAYHPFSEINDWSDWTLIELANTSKNYLMSDVVSVVLPNKLLAIQILKEGVLPLWNPYTLTGYPLLANIQSAVFYPLNIYYFIFSESIAFNIYILSQITLAFAFMYLFMMNLINNKAAALISAISFALSSFMIVWLPWGTVGHAYLYLPLILYSADCLIQKRQRRYLFSFIAGLIFSFFAGHTQTTMVVWALTAGYVFINYRKNILSFFLLFLISLLLIGIQLIPTVEMYQQSVREMVATNNFYLDQTLYPESFLTSVFPNFFGNPVTLDWWGKINFAESAIYFGSVAFILAWFSLLNFRKNKRIYYFYLLLLISFILSTQNFISDLIFNLKLPLISSSTFSRYTMIWIFSGTVLAGIGLNNLLTLHKKDRWRVLALSSLLGFGLITYWFWIYLYPFSGIWLENIMLVKKSSLLPTIIVALSLISISLYTYFIGKFKNGQFILLLILITLTTFELLRFAGKYTPFSPREFFYPPNDLLLTLKDKTTTNRYFEILTPNLNSYYNIKSVTGAEPLYNRYTSELAITAKSSETKVTDRASLQLPDGEYKTRILNLFSVEYILDNQNRNIEKHQLLNNELYKPVFNTPSYVIYQNQNFLPRFALFQEMTVLPSGQATIEYLLNPQTDIKKSVVVNTPGEYPLQGESVKELTVKTDSANEQLLEVSLEKPAILMVTDTNYPGWKAYINNNQVEIIRVNNGFRGLYIPAGSHQIQFIYMPESVIIGAILTIIGVLLSTVFFNKKLFNYFFRKIAVKD